MQSVLMFLAGLSGLALIVALIKPTLFSKNFTRKKALLLFSGGWLFLSVVASSLSASSGTVQTTGKTTTSTQEATPAVATSTPKTEDTSAVDAEKAKSELTAFMKKSGYAGLVTSYEFSDHGNTVFVGAPWYSWTVQQKKDFIAYIAMHKKAFTGYAHFEVRDAYSNEKVGEVTSFSNSLEVYR
jgi:hypothetical protein